MKLIYVSAPYRASTIRDVVLNIRDAESVAISLWRMGFAVICAHLNTALLDGAVPDPVWLAGDLVMLDRCDLVVMLPGWERSVGAQAERERAEFMGIDLFKWPEDADVLAKIAKAGAVDA